MLLTVAGADSGVWHKFRSVVTSTLRLRSNTVSPPNRTAWLGGTSGSVVPSCVFGVRNLRGMAKGEQDARRGSVFDL